MAQPFDDASLQPVGDPFPVAARGSSSASSLRQVAASAAADGTLVYLAGRSRVSQLTWYDRSSKELGKVGPPSIHGAVELSPDGNTVALVRFEPSGSIDCRIYDLVRGSESRVTPPGSRPESPMMWSLDGNFWLGIVGPEGPGLYQGNQKGEPLQLVAKMDVAETQRPSDWSRDGRFLVYTEIDPKARADIWYVPVESGKPVFKRAVKFLGTEAVESQGQLSPDGKWLAYYSDETGEGEVYIRPFPMGSGVWQVSAGAEAAREPHWRSDGRELYYLSASSRGRRSLMAAAVETDRGGGVRIGSPQKLFEARTNTLVPQSNSFSYSPAPDGKRFLVNSLVETGEPTVNVVTNWQKAVMEERAQR